MPVSLRPIADADLPFLYEVYASTRDEELAIVPWTPEEKRAFLRMQFEAQHRYYQDNYPGARFDVIVVDGRRVGRLYVDRRPEETRVIDIALLPRWRRRGIGTELLRGILAEAKATNRVVTIHVEKNNPALTLYDRLGFRPAGDAGVYWLLEWAPA